MARRVIRLALGLVVTIGVLAPSSTAVATAKAATCPLPTFGPGRNYAPVIDPARFSATVDNPYFPLPPGTTWIYEGAKDAKRAVDVVTASQGTRTIDGVSTRIVEDRLFLDGVLEERTSDYYAQDACGNVWYFGEDTAELDADGHVVDTSGSFHAGVDGAEPGVFMQAIPELHRRFRQEWYPGQAEDTYRVADLSTAVTAPFGSFTQALRTVETTALEPGVVDNKWYAAGVGVLVEQTVRGGHETARLVDMIS
jgi:hypothetical protein